MMCQLYLTAGPYRNVINCFFQGDLDVQVSHVRAESRLHVEEGDIHLRLSDAHPLKVKIFFNLSLSRGQFHQHLTSSF